MKTTRLLVTLIALLGVWQGIFAENQAYAVLDDNGQLTFYYNENKPASGAYDIPWVNNPRWYQDRANIKTVKFNASFSNYRLESAAEMFSNCDNLTSIDFANFNTEDVTNMSYMFTCCSSLTSLDVSSLNTSSVTRMTQMFSDCSALTEIIFTKEGAENVFNTENVTDMSSMFEGCSSLEELDLSSFETMNVTYMSSMFSRCASLKKLDLSSFNTTNVTSMENMFYECTSLKKLVLWSFETANVTYMSDMFDGCASLEELDLSSFNTTNVTDMSGMFKGCASLKELDIRNFNTSSVTNMSNMFKGCAELTSLDLSNFETTAPHQLVLTSMFQDCSKLKNLDIRYFSISGDDLASNMFRDCSSLEEILCLNTWYPGNNYSNSYYSQNMFSGCTNLKGGKGSVYNTSYLNFLYAHPDGGTYEDRPSAGYFTEGKPYAILSDGTLTFYYDLEMNTRSGVSFVFPADDSAPGWTSSEYVNSITTVTFDESVIKFTELTAPKLLLSGLSSLTTINNLNNLPTANFTDLSEMFKGCSGLTSLDLSELNTENVTDMSHMFEGCIGLTNLDLSELSTDNVSDMSYMFDGCNNLKSIDLSSFNTENVTDMSYMFSGCSSLEELDLSSFNTENVTDMSYMFNGCSSLATIYCNNDWSDGNVSSSENMFTGCPFVQDNNVTVDFAKPSADGGYFSVPKMAYAYLNNHKLIFRYDDNYINLDYALELQEDEQYYLGEYFGNNVIQVIFEPSFRAFSPTSTANWFAGMENLESITGLEYLNTVDVKYMNSMFYNCYNLTSLDLTSFDVSKVTDMGSMFTYCSGLEMIYAGNWYDILYGKVYSSGMFADCWNLPNWDENNSNDIDFAKPSENGGYFSTRSVYAIVEDDNLTFHFDGYNYQNTYTINENAGGTWTNAPFTTVTFDPSFADYKLTSTAGMFSGKTGLTTIFGLDNLNTSSITDMSNMFNGCSGLTTIYCGKDWSGLNVTSSDGMFAGCTSLVSAISYDNNKTDITYANPYDGYFTQLPQAYAVQEGSVLTFYYDNRINTHSDAITYEIPWLTGGVEGGDEGSGGGFPGWMGYDGGSPITRAVFAPSFAGYDGLENTSRMFYWMGSLTSIEGLENLNTENVTTMQSMFEGCSSLTSLDLTSFNVGKVEDMSYMFAGCSSLETIFCNDDWSDTQNDIFDEYMFGACYSLKGSYGTNIDDFMEDASYMSYAHPDEEDDPGFFTPLSDDDILLYDSSSNTETISNKHAESVNVYLADRILYKDGDWNTLCLPFNVNDGDDNDEITFTGTPLEGATVMTLAENGADFSDGELTLNFEAATTIEAGKPYIIKWEVPEATDEYEDVIVNPFFSGVTISQTNNTIENEYISFVGNYDPVRIGEGGDNTKLFLGARNTLYHPSDAMTINSFRAYFQLKDGLTAGEPVSTDIQGIKSFVLNFGEETGISEISNSSNLSNSSNTYFSLDGRRLLEKPTQKGIYINNGRKVLIK